MSDIYNQIRGRISKVSEKIRTGDNIKDCLEELDFLSTLLGDIFTGNEETDVPDIMKVGDVIDCLVSYNENLPVYVYNNVGKGHESYRFSRLLTFSHNKEKDTIEFYYSTDDKDSYEDY